MHNIGGKVCQSSLTLIAKIGSAARGLDSAFEKHSANRASHIIRHRGGGICLFRCEGSSGLFMEFLPCRTVGGKKMRYYTDYAFALMTHLKELTRLSERLLGCHPG